MPVTQIPVSAIKSVQRGVFSVGTTAASVNITVAAVVVSKTVMNVIPPGNTQNAATGNPLIQLTSPTTIGVSDLDTSNSAKKFSWELIEFY